MEDDWTEYYENISKLKNYMMNTILKNIEMDLF